MRKSLGFIGGGKITKIMLKGFDNSKLKFKRVIVTDSNPIVFERLKNDFPFIHSDSAAAAARQDIVFLTLEQNMLMDTLGLINNDFRDNAIVISTVPNINFAKLALRLPNVNKIARILPVSATYINEAFTPVSFSPGFPVTEKDDVLKLLGNLGKAIEVAEDKLTPYSSMAAVIPAYFWYQWKELINMGRELGLTENETVDFISESALSSLHLNHRSGLSDEQVIDLMPVNPLEDNEGEVREGYRKRLIDLYRKARLETTVENTATGGRR